MDRDELREYVIRSEEITEDSPQMDEANTKKRLVEPFVEDVLGWDGFSDVELEYSVQMGRNPKKVDYALLLEDTPVVFVEAKGLDENLTETEENQLRSYMRQVGVDLGVLTNGKRFVFLKREKDADRPSEITFGDLRLGELTDNEDVVRAVSKELVESNESDVIIEGIRRRRAAVSTLRDEKDEVAEEVVGAVTEKVGESVASVAETEAKEFVDRVVEELENGGGGLRGNTPQSPKPTASDEETESRQESTTDGAVVGTLSRDEIEGDDNATVAVFPTNESGIEFLRNNNAWGFVRVGRQPDYAAMYVTSPVQEVRFFAEVDDIVPAREAELSKPVESYDSIAHFDSDKKVVTFKSGSLYELKDPIPYGGGKTPYSLRYTDLQSFRNAKTTDDIL